MLPREQCCYISLGSNVGDRRAHLAAAVEAMSSHGVEVVGVSQLYETEPQDEADQPWFLNQVLKGRTALEPIALLRALQEIEREGGRMRDRVVRRGPRTIDLDILLLGSTVVASGELQIPHARMAERRFVLEPLLELAPRLVHPGTGLTFASYLEQLRGQRVRKL